MTLTYHDPSASVDTTSAPSGAGPFTYSSGSWTLPDQALVIAIFAVRDGSSLTYANQPSSVTHGTINLVRIDEACGTSTSDSSMETWVGRNISGSGVTATTTATYGETKIGCHIHVFYVTGIVLTSGAKSCVNGFVHSGHATNGLVALNPPQKASNKTFAAFFHRANELSTGFTNGTFTVLDNGTFATPSSSMLSGFDTGAFNVIPRASWPSSSSYISVGLEIREDQTSTFPVWDANPGPNYQFKTGSPWERPIGSAPVHALNSQYLLELNGQVYGAGAGAAAVADDHPYSGTGQIIGALAADLDALQGTTSMTVDAGTVTAFVAGGLAPPFSVVVGSSPNSEHMTVSAWGGTGNTVWTINRTHLSSAHLTGARVQTGKAFLHFVGGFNNSDDFTTFDTPVYRINADADAPLTLVGPKSSAPDYGTTWTGNVGHINTRFLSTADGGQNIGARIPIQAQTYFNAESSGGLSSDAPMILIDRTPEAVFIAWFSEMHYYPSQDKWYAQGASIYYYNSWGIDAATQVVPTDWPAQLFGTGYDPHYYQDSNANGGNDGHRGVNSQAAVIDLYRLYDDGGLFESQGCFMERTNDAGTTHYFPLTGSEHTKGGIIPEGSRFHIKKTVDVVARCTSAGYTGNRLQEAIAIAKGLQDYGVFATDNSGAGCNTKLENTIREGVGNLWSLQETDMDIFPFIDDWEFVEENYDPPAGAPANGTGGGTTVTNKVNEYGRVVVISVG